jgi:hypothetical protein
VRRRDRAGRCVGGLLALTLLGAALAGCDRSSTEAQPQGATVPTAAPTTTTTDPYAVPAVIDIAYVNRVLAGLDAVMGDVIRLIVSTRIIPREAADRVRAVYATDHLLNLTLDGFSQDVAAGLEDYRREPGNRVTKVSQVIEASPSCIFASVTTDYSAISAHGGSSSSLSWVALVPRNPSRDPFSFNETGWMLRYDGVQGDGSAPQTAPCG